MSTYGYPDWSPARDYLSGLSGSQVAIEFGQTQQGMGTVYSVAAGKVFVLVRIVSILAVYGDGVNFPGSFIASMQTTKGLSGSGAGFTIIRQTVFTQATNGEHSEVIIDGPIAISGGASGNDIQYQGVVAHLGGWDGSVLIVGVALN